MKISEVFIQNYRNIESTSFLTDGTTIFIGENNSGKSNILRAISLPLYSEDNSIQKNLSWEDINIKAKTKYYDYIYENREKIVSGTIDKEEFTKVVPTVSVELHFKPKQNELYYVKDISYGVGEDGLQYGLLYRFSIDVIDKLIEIVRDILSIDSVVIEKAKRNLLPINLFSYSITVPKKNTKVAFDVLRQFKYTMLPAERDGFSYDSNKIGYRSLVKLLEARYSKDDMVKIEDEYQSFFETVKSIGDVDRILNWQDDSDIPNAKEFIDSVSVLPNMPPLSSILNGVKLGYADESLSLQGLGYRNLILLLVLLNSWKNRDINTAINMLIMEEPEAHLCINNIRLMCSFINSLTKDNPYVQLVFASHSTEFINKHELKSVVVLDNGKAYALQTELDPEELNYLAKNPNTDIYKLFLSHRCILVEGISEELLIKAYQQSRNDLCDIDVLSFHKGFTKIIDIWIKTNSNNRKKLGIVRDFDNQQNAKEQHEKYNAHSCICVKTTSEYTLEPEIVNTGENYQLLKSKYGEVYGWDVLTKEELSDNWRGNKADIMLTVAQDLSLGKLDTLEMPIHIKSIFDFMVGKENED